MHRRTLLAALGASALPAWAQTPSAGANLSWLVPQPAGNPTDNLARRLLPGLQRELNQTVVIKTYLGLVARLG